MKKQKKKFLLLFALSILVSNTSVFAQNDQNEGPEPPPSAAPIHDAVPIFILLGIALALRVHQKKIIT